MATAILLAALLLAVVPRADATCYLLDANATCAVCWKTVYGDVGDKAGVTKMSECPEGILERWVNAPPTDMTADKEYDVAFSLKLDQSKFLQIPGVRTCFCTVLFSFLKRCLQFLAFLVSLLPCTPCPVDCAVIDIILWKY